MVIGMNNNNQKVPKFRFSGLYNCWSEEELGEISVFNPPSELPDIFEYIDLESVQGTTILNHRTENIKTAPSRAQRLAQWGDIFYQTVRPYQKNNCLYELPYDNYVFSTGYAQIRTNLNKYFLFTYIQNEVFVSKVLERSTGTSYPSINTKDLSKIKIFFPGSYEEQEKIGSFFNKLDKTITLQQQLLNDHKQLKKAMLQKMFPQKGESVPRIRFAGFTQKWENLKLSSLYVKGASGGTPRSTNKSYYIGNIPFLGISDISASNGYIYDTKKHISQEGLDSSSAWLVPKEAISLAMYASVGKVAILKTDVATSQAFYNMIFKNISTRNFIFQYLLKKESTNGWNKLISTGTQANLNAKKIQDLQIMIPSLEEQEKIGDLFGKLDKTITLHEKKLETYQELKKAMLQKMFV